jgi:hypothetical protein
MNLDEIKSILQLMEANKLVEFEYEDDGAGSSSAARRTAS